MTTKKIYNYWLENVSEPIRKVIENYTQEQIEFYFGKNIEFGTAGMRGEMGYGTNAINEFTIASAAFAYGQTLFYKYGEELVKEKGIVIAHDNRKNGKYFSLVAAKVISALGIKVSLFEENELQPTPLLSYTIYKYGFMGGINITASHNPPKDNGFKIYNQFGIQMNVEDTNYIQNLLLEIDCFKISKSEDNIEYLNKSVVKSYINDLFKMIPFETGRKRKELKITFTPQHGTATKIATEILKRMKVNYFLVENQSFPSEIFENTKNPNPQSIECYEEAIKVANKNGSTLIFATDPDADRFGIMVKNKKEWVHINGNELPVVQLFYQLTRLKEFDMIGENDFIVHSNVTSHFGDLIAKSFGVKTFESLTGFKNIIPKVFETQIETKGRCIFAWEESYGSTLSLMTRDKDSFQALIQVIELAFYYLEHENKSIFDKLNDLYKKYGKYEMFQTQKKFPGINGMKQMEEYIQKIRDLNLKEIGGWKVKRIIDYSQGYLNFPIQNCLQIYLENDSWISIRPSGTEPILRFYFDLKNIANKEELENFFNFE